MFTDNELYDIEIVHLASAIRFAMSTGELIKDCADSFDVDYDELSRILKERSIGMFAED